MNKSYQRSKEERQRLAESVEQRGLAEGNTPQPTTTGTQRPDTVSSGLQRVREAARRDKRLQFTALLHHIDESGLLESYRQLKRDAAPGIDGQNWKDYQPEAPSRITQLHNKLHQGSYRALPTRRKRIDKEDGSQRSLGIAALEDKIVQRATVSILNAIYEEDFLGFSYGFRPGRDPHKALDALWVGLTEKPIQWVVDLDIQGYFDHIQHDWLMRFLSHRVADKRLLRLVGKWLRAGVMDGKQWLATEQGSAQGSVISPLLANIYLHYSFDLWVQRRRRREVRGAMIVVRYADDIVVGFEHESEARAFLRDVETRLKQFGLTLHPKKSRLLAFGRGVAEPETFQFLGFTHIASKTRQGRFVIRRKTVNKRLRRKLRELKRELRQRLHDPVSETGQWLKQVLQGYYQYYAVPYNLDCLNQFRYELSRAWLRTLRRRSQKARSLTWEKFKKLICDRWLPTPRVLHPWPNVRFRRQHPRQEPYAVVPHVRICTGGAP
jgi:group II intron reverse transcriptase/maturase